MVGEQLGHAPGDAAHFPHCHYSRPSRAFCTHKWRSFSLSERPLESSAQGIWNADTFNVTRKTFENFWPARTSTLQDGRDAIWLLNESGALTKSWKSNRNEKAWARSRLLDMYSMQVLGNCLLPAPKVDSTQVQQGSELHFYRKSIWTYSLSWCYTLGDIASLTWNSKSLRLSSLPCIPCAAVQIAILCKGSDKLM